MRHLIFCLALMPLVAQDAPKPAGDPAPAAQAAKPEAEKPKAEEAKPAEAAPAAGPTVTGSVDLGYRFVTNGGNYDAYRSVVNLGEGPKVFGFDLSFTSPTSRFYDKINLFGSGWGGDPNQTLRFDAAKQKLYDFRVDYRNIAYYNFLGSFANPAIDRNVFSTQQGFDLRRRTIDMVLRFRPGTWISPYLAYTRNWGEGRGVADYVTGSVNQYPVASTTYDKTDQFRGGVNLEFAKFHVTLEQGGTIYKDDQTLSNGKNISGARTTPSLDQTAFLTNLIQAERVRGSSIFERAIATWTPFSWVDFSGSFLYSQPKDDVLYTQAATGNFPDPRTFQVLTSQSMYAAANSNQPHSTGNINLELRPIRRVRILESWMTDRYHTSSSIALNNVSFLTTPVFANPGGDRLFVNYSRQQVQANVEVFSWLTVRGGWRKVWGDAQVRAPLENGVQYQPGNLDQQVGLLGGQIRMGQKLWVNGDAELASTSQVYFRTSLADYRKGTIRARYQLFNSLSLTGNFFALTNENPNPAVRFDLQNYQESVGLLWNPKNGQRITFMADYTRSSIESNLNYASLPFLSPELSNYHENSHTGTAVIDVAPPVKGKYGPKLQLGGSFYTSSGSRPTSFYSPIVKLNVPVHERVQFFTEWRYYGLSEALYSNEGFRSNIFMTGLRLVR